MIYSALSLLRGQSLNTPTLLLSQLSTNVYDFI